MNVINNSELYIRVLAKALTNQVNDQCGNLVINSIHNSFCDGVNPVKAALFELGLNRNDSLIQSLSLNAFNDELTLAIIDNDKQFKVRFEKRDLFESRAYDKKAKLKLFKLEFQAEIVNFLNVVVEKLSLCKSNGETMSVGLVKDVYIGELANAA